MVLIVFLDSRTFFSLTLLPLCRLVLLVVLEGGSAGGSVRWKYTLLGRSAVSDWAERFRWTDTDCSVGSLTLKLWRREIKVVIQLAS